MKPLKWDDDVLIIADDTILVLDTDSRLNVLKGNFLAAALQDLHPSEKEILIKVYT
jgi:hypothetical protein